MLPAAALIAASSLARKVSGTMVLSGVVNCISTWAGVNEQAILSEQVHNTHRINNTILRPVKPSLAASIVGIEAGGERQPVVHHGDTQEIRLNMREYDILSVDIEQLGCMAHWRTLLSAYSELVYDSDNTPTAKHRQADRHRLRIGKEVAEDLDAL